MANFNDVDLAERHSEGFRSDGSPKDGCVEKFQRSFDLIKRLSNANITFVGPQSLEMCDYGERAIAASHWIYKKLSVSLPDAIIISPDNSLRKLKLDRHGMHFECSETENEFLAKVISDSVNFSVPAHELANAFQFHHATGNNPPKERVAKLDERRNNFLMDSTPCAGDPSTNSYSEFRLPGLISAAHAKAPFVETRTSQQELQERKDAPSGSSSSCTPQVSSTSQQPQETGGAQVMGQPFMQERLIRNVAGVHSLTAENL